MTDAVQKAFFDYVERTVVGCARVLYKNYKVSEINIRQKFIDVMHLQICSYLNMCYQSLLTGDDECVLKSCAPFASHSPRCLFVLMHDIMMLGLEKMDFSLFAWDSLEPFSVSFRLQWILLAVQFADRVSANFLHRCQGPRKLDCKIGEPLFIISSNPFDLKNNSVAWYCCFEGCSKISMLRCSRCHTARYCSREHQKNHWSTHKKMCSERSNSV
jgi:hypothetical protein